jgi:hypothetical protein
MSSLIKKYQRDLYFCSQQKEALKRRRNEDVMELFRLREANAKGTVFAPEIERKKEKFQCKFQSNGFMPPRFSTGGGVLEDSLVETANGTFASEIEEIEKKFEKTVTDIMRGIERLDSEERQRVVVEVNAQLIDGFHVNNALLRELDDVPFHYEDLLGDQADAVLERSRQVKEELIEQLIEIYQEDVRKADENTMRARNELNEEIELFALLKELKEEQRKRDLEFDREFDESRRLWDAEKEVMEQRLLAVKNQPNVPMFPIERRKRIGEMNQPKLDIYTKRTLVKKLLMGMILSILLILVMYQSKQNLTLKSRYSSLSTVTEGLMQENDDLRRDYQKEIQLCNTVVKAQLVELKEAEKTLAEATEFVYDFDPSKYTPDKVEPGATSGLLSVAAIFAFTKQNVFGNR